jgi:hypothetical protein
MSVKHHFQQYFSYNVEVTFITGGNRRKSRTKYKSECEENVFLVSNKISDNPAATPLPPFIYIRRGVLDTTLCDKVCQ